MVQDISYEAVRYTHDPKRAAVWAAVASYLSKWIPRTGTTLELAAGYCDLSNALDAARRVAIDISPSLPRHAAAGVEAQVGDATDLSAFESSSVDTVLASNFLEHLNHAQVDSTLDEILRVLKPSGRVILIQPNFRLSSRRYFDDYTHRTIFTDTSLRDHVASRGFTIERVEARFLPFSMQSRLSFGYRLVPLYLRLPYRPLAGQMLVVARRS